MQQKNQTVFTLKLKCTCILTYTHMLCSYTCIWIYGFKELKKKPDKHFHTNNILAFYCLVFSL